LYFLAWRDLLVRYKQTVIGVSWALIRPALTMLVFVAFRRLAGLEGGGAPDAIIVFAAILPWQFFSTALTESSSSLISSSDLISKVYFPRLIVPFAAVMTSLVDFMITLGILALLMAWYGVAPGPEILALPFFVLLAFVLALGLGLFLSALNVKYRDFRYVVPFIVQFGLFVSPVAFTLDRVPAQWQLLYSINPMVGIIEGFRWSVLGPQASLEPAAVSMAIIVTAVTLVIGVAYFRRTERGFADVI
jgi:lipopolysaccharide transport system permease protein